MGRDCRALVLLLLVGCSSLQLVEVQDVDTLYFGGSVGDAEWKAFTDEVITPAYPGFTEWKAIGHWRGVEEGTRVVQIAHLSRRRNDGHIIDIIKEYKRRFRQESVLWIRERGLVAPE